MTVKSALTKSEENREAATRGEKSTQLSRPHAHHPEGGEKSRESGRCEAGGGGGSGTTNRQRESTRTTTKEKKEQRKTPPTIRQKKKRRQCLDSYHQMRKATMIVTVGDAFKTQTCLVIMADEGHHPTMSLHREREQINKQKGRDGRAR